MSETCRSSPLYIQYKTTCAWKTYTKLINFDRKITTRAFCLTTQPKEPIATFRSLFNLENQHLASSNDANPEITLQQPFFTESHQLTDRSFFCTYYVLQKILMTMTGVWVKNISLCLTIALDESNPEKEEVPFVWVDVSMHLQFSSEHFSAAFAPFGTFHRRLGGTYKQYNFFNYWITTLLIVYLLQTLAVRWLTCLSFIPQVISFSLLFFITNFYNLCLVSWNLLPSRCVCTVWNM